MNFSELFQIIIISATLGVRFIPIISISEVFGGKYVPMLVRSSLIGILGFFRYLILPVSSIPDGFDIRFVLSEFFIGYIISLPFILLVKFIISSASTIENLFGSMGVLNSQGIFDERGSALEMIFEMIVISLIFLSGAHLNILSLILKFSIHDLSYLRIQEVVFHLLSNFNILSKNCIGYFLPILLLALSALLLMAFSDMLGTNLNLSSCTFILNAILIFGGIVFLLKNIVNLIGIDIARVSNLTDLIAGLLN
ncbi:MAG: hypothetical protein ACP5KG_08355 [Myxococcota bacterium]